MPERTSAQHSDGAESSGAVRRRTGRSAFLELLKQEGITHLFGNPGTTELPIMNALTDHPDLTYVMAMQESLVVTMADGYSRASGRLAACNVHVAPGLGNALGAVYNAKFTGTPLLITAGQQEQGHGLMEPLLYDDLVRMAQPLVKWAVEVTRLEDLPRIVHRAAKIATTAPTGPVFISLPGDILNAECELDLGAPTRVRTRVAPSGPLMRELVERILRAQRPVIVAGDELVKSDALEDAGRLAALLGCPAYQQTIAYGAHFPSEHPCFMGPLPRKQSETHRMLAEHDLLIVLGADPLRMSIHSEDAPIARDLPIVQIGLVDGDLGKNFPTEIALKADVGATLEALLPALEEAGTVASRRRAARGGESIARSNWSARREALVAQIAVRSGAEPIDPDWLTLQLVEALPDDAILVDEALTTSRHLLNLRAHRDRYGFHALASGGIGWSLPASVGMSLANPGRPVICFTGDGSAMFSIQALWTAAHHRLPVTFVIANNGGYRIIKQRLMLLQGSRNFVGMDFADPGVDFTALAGGLGVEAVRVSDPGALPAALAEAIGSGTTRLVEVMVDRSV